MAKASSVSAASRHRAVRRRSCRFAACIAALAAVSVCGCADIGRVAPAHATKPIEAYDEGDVVRHASIGYDPAPRWWRVFGDATLERIVDDATAGSPSLAAVRERVDEALAQVDEQRAERQLHVGAGASLVPTRFPGSYKIPKPAAGHWQTDSQLLAGLSMNLDVAGRIDASVRAAAHHAAQQRALAQGATVALQTAIVASYLQLARDIRLRRIAEDALEHHRTLAHLTDERVAAGLDERTASLRAAEPIPLAEAALARDDAAIAVSRNRIALLAGRGPGYADRLAPDAAILDAQVPPLRALPVALVARRADVAAAKANAESEAARIDAARAAFYPDIDLLAFAGLQSLGLRALLHGNSASLGIGPALTLPIFEGGRLRAGLKAQVAAYNAAVTEYDDSVAHALAETSDTLAALGAARTERDLTRIALTRAAQTYELETRRYQRGLCGYLDVLLAQQRLLEDSTADVQARAASLVAYVQLIGALGGAPDAAARQEANPESEK